MNVSRELMQSLPPDVLRACAELRPYLTAGRRPASVVMERLFEALGATTLVGIDRKDRSLAYLLDLDIYVRWWGADLSRATTLWLTLLDADPRLAWPFLSHRNGHARHKALLLIQTPPENPFLCALLLLRLNDWATPVREAAENCAARVLQHTDAKILAAVASELAVEQAAWGRWSAHGREIFQTALNRPDVAAAVAENLRARQSGPLARTLRYLLAAPAIDSHLLELARQAHAPGIRAVAWETLLRGRAVWRTDVKWVWADKTRSLRKKVPIHAARPLTAGLIAMEASRDALRDRAASVRKRALEAMVGRRPLPDDFAPLIDALRRDRSAGVRWRADFLIRKPHPSDDAVA